MDRDPPAIYGDRLAVVTVTRSPGAALDHFLDSLAGATARPVCVVLADTCSADGAPERAAARVGVELLRIGEDVGRAAAVNRAVAGLGPEVGWVAVAAPEVEWRAGTLDALLAAAARYPRAAALGPLVHDPNGAVLATACPLPRLAGLLAAAGPLPALANLLRGRVPARICTVVAGRTGPVVGRASAPTGAAEGPVGWLSAACLLVRRTAWDSVEGFDPRYVGALDDVDLADRLGRAGWLCVHVPTAEVVLTGERDGMLEPPARAAARYLADRRPGLRHVPRRVALRLRAAVGGR